MDDIVGIAGGAAGGAATGTSIAPGWGTAIGAVVGALISWYGMSKQEEANKEAQQTAKNLDARDYANSVSQFNQQISLKKKEMAMSEATNAREFKFKKENRDFELMNNISTRLLSIMNNQPQLQALLTQRYGTPKAQAYDFRSLNPIGRN
jgi:uncharacterized membrane protein YhiD involved in acid resistance